MRRPEGWTTLMRMNGLIEWVCPHGVGHPAPLEHQKFEMGDCDYIHGCDGCCSVYEEKKDDAVRESMDTDEGWEAPDAGLHSGGDTGA